MDFPERKADDGMGLIREQITDTNVVCVECNDNTNDTSSFGNIEVVTELSTGQYNKGDSQETEQADESDAFAQTCESQDASEHSPGKKEDSKSALELSHIGTICGYNTASRKKNRRIRHPECAIGSESSSTESIALGEFPHAGKNLSEPTTENSHADNNVRVRDSAGVNVKHRQDKSGGRERE